MYYTNRIRLFGLTVVDSDQERREVATYQYMFAEAKVL